MDFSSLDCLSNIIQSQNKAFSIFKTFLISLLFMDPPAACKACVIFVSVMHLRSQAALLYSALAEANAIIILFLKIFTTVLSVTALFL